MGIYRVPQWAPSVTVNGRTYRAVGDGMLIVTDADDIAAILNLGGVADPSSSPIVSALLSSNNTFTGSNTFTAPVYVGDDLTFKPDATATPAHIGDLAFEATDDTTLTIRFKGSDGTVRSVALTLA